jgi:hypothetical protein
MACYRDSFKLYNYIQVSHQYIYCLGIKEMMVKKECKYPQIEFVRVFMPSLPEG